MKYLNLVISLVIICSLVSCNDCSRRMFGAGGEDTVIHSIPNDYMKKVEKLSSKSKHEIASYRDMLEVFEKLDYTPEAWQSGIREIPRVFLTVIGDRWGATSANEVTAEDKKRIFFRGIAPMVLYANELILKDRARLEEIRSTYERKKKTDKNDQTFIRRLAALYKVNTDSNIMTPEVLDELWMRVDIVPTSLALAQSAEESGWGTSRFAAAGNALYGQWTWGSAGIRPEHQRTELGNYGIAAFDSPQESICAYMLNLNTHNAYASLRAKRAELRKNGEPITGNVLAEQLTRYSERGEEYVYALKSLMNRNRLAPTDLAYLSDGPAIYLVPAKD